MSERLLELRPLGGTTALALELDEPGACCFAPLAGRALLARGDQLAIASATDEPSSLPTQASVRLLAVRAKTGRGPRGRA